MVTFTEGRHPGEFLLSEANFHRSRESVKIAENQTIQPGQLLGGKVVVADAASVPSASAGNTGNATVAMGVPPLTTKAKNGRYKGIALTATTVRWEDPDGAEIGTSTHGVAMTKGGIKITITAGGTPNVAGDEFYVDVFVEKPFDYEFVAFDPVGTDGSEVVAGIALYPATTGAGQSQKIAAVLRDAEANGHVLVLPEGITANQTAKAYADLAGLGIIVRN